MKIFISYRRFDSSAYAGRIHDRLVATYGENNVFKDVNDIPIGRDFRGVLSEEVAKCDVLLVLIGREWLDIRDGNGNRRLDNPGDFVRIEIRSGLQRGDDKCLIVPVLLSGAQMPQSNQLPDDLSELAYKNAVIVRDDPDFHHDMAHLIASLDRQVAPPPRPPRRNRIIALAIVFLVVLVALGIALRAIFPPTQSSTLTIASEASEEPQPDTPSLTPTVPTVTNTASITPTSSPTATNTETHTPKPPTITPTSDPLDEALERAQTGVLTNNQWDTWYPSGFRQQFEGIIMVLVPRGCFRIGASPQDADEHNGNVICFDEPFWIDQTEVTQTQFERLNGTAAETSAFRGDNRPVESVTWFEARDFCEQRDARLPTEVEWEYAARGPDESDYPWGDEWGDYNAQWNRNSSDGTANVGRIPEGASWVEAFDMSGNVWEWVNSLYVDYPYDIAHENTLIDVTGGRVLRGGSWYNYFPEALRSANRNVASPGYASNLYGFRCARSID
jgi:formylglycine-generating enzyme required for sulfatase activity